MIFLSRSFAFRRALKLSTPFSENIQPLEPIPFPLLPSPVQFSKKVLFMKKPFEVWQTLKVWRRIFLDNRVEHYRYSDKYFHKPLTDTIPEKG
jgi:hypothetical protein